MAASWRRRRSRAAPSTTPGGCRRGWTPKPVRPRARKWSRKIFVDFEMPSQNFCGFPNAGLRAARTSARTLVLILLKGRGAGNQLDTGSLLHLQTGLWRAGLSRAAVRLRHRAGMHGGWQWLAEPKGQPDADGCELRLQLRHTPEGVLPPY
jgi:hypothetical protein